MEFVRDKSVVVNLNSSRCQLYYSLVVVAVLFIRSFVVVVVLSSFSVNFSLEKTNIFSLAAFYTCFVYFGNAQIDLRRRTRGKNCFISSADRRLSQSR